MCLCVCVSMSLSKFWYVMCLYVRVCACACTCVCTYVCLKGQVCWRSLSRSNRKKGLHICGGNLNLRMITVGIVVLSANSDLGSLSLLPSLMEIGEHSW